MSTLTWCLIILGNLVAHVLWHLEYGLLRKKACRWFGHPAACVVESYEEGCLCCWFCLRCGELRSVEAGASR